MWLLIRGFFKYLKPPPTFGLAPFTVQDPSLLGIQKGLHLMFLTPKVHRHFSTTRLEDDAAIVGLEVLARVVEVLEKTLSLPLQSYRKRQLHSKVHS
jgi:hypothetical protein